MISVDGLVGGTSETIYKIDNCVNLNIEVTGDRQIDVGEYQLNSCDIYDSNITVNKLNCTCDTTTPFELILNTTDNTINNYAFKLNYTYYKKTNTFSGGGGHSFNQEPVNITKFIFINNAKPDPNIIVRKPTLFTKDTTTSTTVTTTSTTSSYVDVTTTTMIFHNVTEMLEEKPQNNNIWIFTLISIILIVVTTLSVIGYILFICPNCKSILTIKLIGNNKIKKCRNCGSVFTMGWKKHEIPFKKEGN